MTDFDYDHWMRVKAPAFMDAGPFRLGVEMWWSPSRRGVFRVRLFDDVFWMEALYDGHKDAIDSLTDETSLAYTEAVALRYYEKQGLEAPCV